MQLNSDLVYTEDMASKVETAPAETEIALTSEDQDQVAAFLLEQAFEDIIHDVLADVYRGEKNARLESAVIELEQQAELAEKEDAPKEFDQGGGLIVETEAAIWKDGKMSMKGNPFKVVKNILCPNCRLPRLLYPRVGFNSRPVPDPSQQYCKNEPVIIIDKHDVHGQRKKGVKVKGQGKGKNKKKTDPSSPASSEPSDPMTPSTSSFPTEAFEFKEIDYPAAKCPNRDSHLGDHWKSVNVFATHLNGSCYLKKDRAAGREATAKISGTPRDSRASSPKLPNGVKRARASDDNEGNGKKKQKLESPKKNAKKSLPGPSKLRETTGDETDDKEAPTNDPSDTIQVAKGVPSHFTTADVDADRTKVNGLSRKKPGKNGKKASAGRAAVV